MHALHIALQDGFAHDVVIVSLDGVQLLRKGDLSTREQIGLAAFVDTLVVAGTHSLQIELPKRGGVRCQHSFVVTADTWLGISLRPNGECAVRESTRPFGYP